MDGVKARDWINEKSGVITFYLDAAGDSYILGVRQSGIAPGKRTSCKAEIKERNT